MHYFPGMDIDTVMYKLSYTNLNMLLAAIPSYESDDDKNQPKTKARQTPEDAKVKELDSFFKGCT
jgi:hypothetical protein